MRWMGSPHNVEVVIVRVHPLQRPEHRRPQQLVTPDICLACGLSFWQPGAGTFLSRATCTRMRRGSIVRIECMR